MSDVPAAPSKLIDTPATSLHVSWSEVQRVLVYCGRVRAKLALSHWDVGVSVEPEPENAHAAIQTSPGRYFGTLYLHASWMEKSIDLKRSVLLHEMLHLLHQKLDYVNIDHWRDKTDISVDRWDQFNVCWHTEAEYMVDGLNTALVRLPGFLPAWPSASEAKRINPRNDEP